MMFLNENDFELTERNSPKQTTFDEQGSERLMLQPQKRALQRKSFVEYMSIRNKNVKDDYTKEV